MSLTSRHILAFAAATLPLVAVAQPLQDTVEYARVLRVAPIMGPEEAHEVCSMERGSYAPPPREHSNAGAVLGGLGGALVGSRFGDGNGKVAATIVGAIGGSMMGDRYANDDRRDAPPAVERCRTVVQPGRTTGYMVTYEYQGQRDTINMNRDPGQWLRVHKTVTIE
ncbi:MAG TPA: glycine zipper 2TM domain-containing protein [Rhodocyclaceae bacterium]|nr:glycine zipper 2TM domain-containing protein [Rhodocyclaceae bacterium]